MKVLWMTWKDRLNPEAGGAEVINEEIAKRLTRDRHEVIFLVANFRGGAREEIKDGYRIIRLGNRYTVYWEAYKYYKKNLADWADCLIEEVNTIPFFTRLYAREKRVYLFYQLCREVWFYQIFFPASVIGYILEPLYLKILTTDKLCKAILTESESAKKDLVRHGFDEEKIHIFSVCNDISPITSLDLSKKYSEPTLLSLGALRSMKRTAHQIKAFEIAKLSISGLKMIIAGDATSKYGQKVLKMIKKSRFSEDIKYVGRVASNEKTELMQKSHAILVTSVKEGWGLIVTEANSQGTPAIVYNVDGLRDSVKHDQTGLVAQYNRPQSLADEIKTLINNQDKYAKMVDNAWNWSKSFNFDDSYKIILKSLE
jgi:glycosyltransferase involved in cell wall biosynthesis